MATFMRRRFASPLSLIALLLMPVTASADAMPVCSAPGDLNRFDQPLTRVSQRVMAGQPITIVAIGSSSTAGAGASSSAGSYPSRLEVELKQRFPASTIRVLNRGVNGEEAADMLARFDKSVLAEKPDLVLWQVGTNSVLRDGSLEDAAILVRQGLERLKASGADVVLIDPQFAPKVIAKPEAESMVGLIRVAAKAVNAQIFHRFAVMRHWRQHDRIAFEKFLSPDGLHMNDWSYGCIAKLLAASISEAAMRATAVAGAVPASRIAAPQSPR